MVFFFGSLHFYSFRFWYLSEVWWLGLLFEGFIPPGKIQIQKLSPFSNDHTFLAQWLQFIFISIPILLWRVLSIDKPFNSCLCIIIIDKFMDIQGINQQVNASNACKISLEPNYQKRWFCCDPLQTIDGDKYCEIISMMFEVRIILVILTYFFASFRHI